LVLVFVSLVAGGFVTASHSQQFSLYDEWVYYDYVTKIPTQFVVREGEAIGHDALKAMSCEGDAFGPRGDPCGSSYQHLGAYPQGGKTSADLYTPLYFAATWVVAKAIQFFSGADLLIAARYAGLLWISAGVGVFAYALRRMRVGPLVTLGLGLAYIASPGAMYSNTYISSDAPSFLIGAVLFLLMLRFIQGHGSGWWLLPVAVVGTLLKVSNILAAGLVLLILVIFALSRLRTPDRLPRGVTPRKLIVVGVVTAVSGLVAEVIWLGIRSLIKVGPQPSQGINGVLDTRTVGNLIQVFFPGPLGATSSPLSTPAFLYMPLGWLAVAGVVGLLFMTKQWGFLRSFGVSVAVASTLFAPTLLIGMYLALGTVPPVSGRYAISLVPFVLATIPFILKNRMSKWFVVFYGPLLVLIVVFYAIRLIALGVPLQ
jgi:hypothetical protein